MELRSWGQVAAVILPVGVLESVWTDWGTVWSMVVGAGVRGIVWGCSWVVGRELEGQRWTELRDTGRGFKKGGNEWRTREGLRERESMVSK